MRTNPGPPRTSRGQEKDYKGPHRQKVQFYRKLSNQYTIHVYQKLNIENITPQKHFEPGSLNFPSNQHYFWRRWHHPQRPSIRDLCSTTLWIIQYLQLLKNYIIESLLIPAHKIFWACKWLLGALIAGSTPIELGMYCFFCVVREYRLFNKKPVNQLFSDMYYQVLHLTHIALSLWPAEVISSAQCDILIDIISTYIKLKLHWNRLQNQKSIQKQNA